MDYQYRISSIVCHYQLGFAIPPSKSPMATEAGLEPVAKSTLAAKLVLLMLPLVEVLCSNKTVAELSIRYCYIGFPISVQITNGN